jgi:LDH2 family malate/lactate/ureidoglycolate dehydrogenase
MTPRTLPTAAVRDPLVRRLERALGLHPDDAAITVDHWLRSEQAGKPCHGLVRAAHVLGGGFGPYAGARAPAPAAPAPGRLHVDGAAHLGYPLLHRLVDAGCDEAARRGVCVATGVGVYPSGALGDWARRACARGCGLLLLAGSPPRVAAPGGRAPLLGTNPICVGLPTAPHFFVCDAATSAITHGDLLLARSHGAALPPGAAVDRDGARTLDAAAAELGALLPIGGSPKAFALGMAVELLTSLGGGVPGEHGVFAVFLGPALVADAAARLSARLADFAAAGARIPGWHAAARLADLTARDEVELAPATLDRLAPLLAGPPRPCTPTPP